MYLGTYTTFTEAGGGAPVSGGHQRTYVRRTANSTSSTTTSSSPATTSSVVSSMTAAPDTMSIALQLQSVSQSVVKTNKAATKLLRSGSYSRQAYAALETENHIAGRGTELSTSSVLAQY